MQSAHEHQSLPIPHPQHLQQHQLSGEPTLLGGRGKEAGVDEGPRRSIMETKYAC